MEELAGKVGVEPTLAESESAVLPLDDFPSEVMHARPARVLVHPRRFELLFSP
jgi:hypothetical protein